MLALIKPTPAQLEEFNLQFNKLDVDLLANLKQHPSFHKLVNLLSCSDWGMKWSVQAPNTLINAFLKGDFEQPLNHLKTQEMLFEALKSALSLEYSEQLLLNFMHDLRNIRKLNILHIAYRDINQLDTLATTLANTSFLASTIIDTALTYCYQKNAEKFGNPRDATGLIVNPIVIGMGKLGGHELNFSSDVDLMIAYRENGETDGKKPIENQLFFNKVTQALVKILETHTVDGFVYRVDLRLRPFGDTGALSMSIAGFENYYVSHGRDWERYALIKARPIAGDIADGRQLLAQLRPFIYRKYIDYSMIDALRDMKAMIAADVIKKDLQRNVKLGPGGIREIEFIGQSFQLVYGGREQQLRLTQIIPTLKYLKSSERLSASAEQDLYLAYCFLRQVENRLQLKDDLQTHDLPYAQQAKSLLAQAMGFELWADFVKTLLIHVEKVKHQFINIFGAAVDAGESANFVQSFNNVWQSLNVNKLAQWLSDNNIEDASELISRTLIDFHQDCFIKSTQACQKKLEKLIPLALMELADAKTKPSFASKPDLSNKPIVINQENFVRELNLFLNLIETVSKRTPYLALLIENPRALAQLLNLCTQSPWIMRYLAKYPLLLDELLAPIHKIMPLDKKQLNKELTRLLKQAETLNASHLDDPHLDARHSDTVHSAARHPDVEHQLEILRDFHHAQTLKVAMADLSGKMPLMIVSDHLTEIAEVLLNTTLKLAWSDLSLRYGEPMFIEDEQIHSAEFAIIAYGKLGGLELGYGSDLDVVFLHNSSGTDQVTNGEKSIENSLFFVKLAQKIIYYLTTQTLSGILYEVDTRLRPSGKSGLLVSSIENFRTYQLNQAWTWEHQALIRARFVIGSQSLGKYFGQIRHEILTQKRNHQTLKKDVLLMREKMMQAHVNNQDLNELKTKAGGMVDIEFIVQYLVLAHAHHANILVKFTDNIRQLAALEAAGILSSAHAMILRDAYCKLRAYVHHAKLKETQAIVINPVVAVKIQHVIEIWDELFKIHI
ncbi:glutamate-ammonia-ligase adenylyltransferase [Gammaproteobacteria bacterium]|nr:glutamate-ammonia-ligase adenylyltransferase [Gammaproteobacteria bacterium]